LKRSEALVPQGKTLREISLAIAVVRVVILSEQGDAQSRW
jgi:hypothetical protein